MKKAAIIALALAAGCAREEAPAAASGCAAAPDGEISVRDLWIRPAAAGQTSTALYATVCNRTGAPQALVAVAADGVETVELHETRRSEDGTVSMVKMDRFEVPAETASLAPGGAHVMLIGLPGALEEGSFVDVSITFSNGSTLMASAPVRAAEPSSSAHEHSH